MTSWPPVGGNWEGGRVDRDGRMWHHVANVGWQEANATPYLTPAPRKPWWRRWLATPEETKP